MLGRNAADGGGLLVILGAEASADVTKGDCRLGRAPARSRRRGLKT